MDEEIAKWIIEFLLRQDFDDRLLNDLLSTLPLPNNDPRLKKALLLRRIGTEVSNGSVNEKILDFLEIFEELDHREGKPASQAMKAAYCAVAVDCTVRFLEVEMENNGKYIATVKRIWRERVDKMEKLEGKAGLLSEKLVRWKEDILAAIWETDVRDRILSMNTRHEALKAVKGYLAEAWKDFGPSFLELAAVRERQKGETGEEMNGGQIAVFNGQIASDVAAATTNTDGDRISEEQNPQVDEPAVGDEEPQRMVRAPARHKHVAGHSGAWLGATRRAKIVDDEGLDEDISPKKDNGLHHPPEVPRMQEKELVSGLNEVQNVARVATEKGAENMSGQSTRVNLRERIHQWNVLIDNDADKTQKRNKGDSHLHGPRDQINPSRASLMDLNPSAQTYRWEDSSDGLLEASPIQSRIASPKRRRVKKKWSSLEEDTLREGVKKFGKGNWKFLLNAYRNVFEGRTEVDLKDKWRNLMR